MAHKLKDFALNIVSSLLSTILISLLFFMLVWYLTTKEFPPKVAHVKARIAQYQSLLKMSQEMFAKLDAQGVGDQGIDKLTQKMNGIDMQQMQELMAQMQKHGVQGQPASPAALTITPEQWQVLNQRLSHLEAEIQQLKTKRN